MTGENLSNRKKGWKEPEKRLQAIKISWMAQISMAAKSIGMEHPLPRAGVIAQAVCEETGWQFTSVKNVIQKRALWVVDNTYQPKPALPIVRQEETQEKPERKRHKTFKRSSAIPKLGAPHPSYVKDDGFYSSRAWKEIRYLALVTHGFACQACGAKAVGGEQLHVDHIKPRYKYPHLSLCLSNLGVLCGTCNIGKGAWSEVDYRNPVA